MHDMPLLVFTLLEQAAIGAFLTLVGMRLAGKAAGGASSFKVGLVLFVLSVVAMGASLFHLGQPLRAVNVMFGLGSSHLSREVLFFGLFVVCVLVYSLLERAGKTSPAKVLGVLGAVGGVLALVSTSLSYLVPGVPAWNTFATPAQFVLTTVVCGVTLYGALAATFAEKRGGRAMGAWWVAFLVLLATQVVMRWFFFADIVTLVSELPLA